MGRLLDWLIENEPSFRKSRIPSLYSDLSVQKSANPEGYAANVTAWQCALTAAALAGQMPSDHSLVLDSSDELLDVLSSPQYGKPSGLGLVFDDSVRSGKMLDIKDFMTAPNSIYHRGWLPSPWSIVRWGLKQTGLFGSSSYDAAGQLRRGQLVIVAALEETSKQAMTAQAAKVKGFTDRLLTRGDFSRMVNTNCKTTLTAEEEEVLLKYMARDKQLLVYNETTVKFKATSATSPEALTPEDCTIASLRSWTQNLAAQISELEKRSEALKAKAVSAVHNKNKQVALSALRSKKLVDRTLQQRTDTLHQVEEVFAKLEEAVDQVQVVEAMQASAVTLKTLNKQVGDVEKIEDVVEDLREQMSKVDEVGQVLQEPLDPSAVVDEAELDDELEAMERKERELQDRQEAETTRRRLEELEKMEQQKQTQENDLRSSIERLENLDIARKEQESSQAERIAEQSAI